MVYAEFGKVRDEITSAVTGDVSAALGNYVKKTDLNTINGRSLTGESSTNIEVGTIRDVKVNNTSVVNGTTANIDLTGYVPSTDYNALLERVVALEKFMTGSTFITASNIANYAVTSIASTDTDIDVNGNKGDVTITLNGISNIAYNDATE